MENRPKHSAALGNRTQTGASLSNRVKSPVTLTGRSKNTASLTNRHNHAGTDYLLATEALDFLVCENGDYILISSTGSAINNRDKHVAI